MLLAKVAINMKTNHTAKSPLEPLQSFSSLASHRLKTTEFPKCPISARNSTFEDMLKWMLQSLYDFPDFACKAQVDIRSTRWRQPFAIRQRLRWSSTGMCPTGGDFVHTLYKLRLDLAGGIIGANNHPIIQYDLQKDKINGSMKTEFVLLQKFLKKSYVYTIA